MCTFSGAAPGRPRGPRNRGSREAPKWAPESGSAQGPRGTLGYGPCRGPPEPSGYTHLDRHPSTGPPGISSPPVGRHTARTRVGGGLAWCLATWSLNFVSWVVGMSLVSLHWGMVASHGAYSRNQLSVWVPGPIDRLVCFALRFFRRVYVATLGTAT